MKVAHVVRQFKPLVGGMEEAVFQLCKALQQSGFCQPKVISLDRPFTDNTCKLPPTSKIEDIEVVRIPFFGSARYPIAPTVLPEIREADLVHVHGVDFFFDYLAATKSIHKRKLVASTHGGFFHTDFLLSFKKFYFNTVTRVTSRSYDAILASSESDAELFRSISPQNVRTIENGVDILKWHMASSPHITKSIVAIGRFSYNKNLIFLIDILHEIVKVDKEWKLTILGTDSDLSSLDLAKHIETQALWGSVTVVDNASDDEIKKIINMASFYISASSYEGFGLAAVEALSAGLFPLLSDIPPYRRLKDRMGAGLLFNLTTPKEIAHRIISSYEGILQSYGEIRHKLVNGSSMYSWDEIVLDVAEVYRTILRK